MSRLFLTFLLLSNYDISLKAFRQLLSTTMALQLKLLRELFTFTQKLGLVVTGCPTSTGIITDYRTGVSILCSSLGLNNR